MNASPQAECRKNQAAPPVVQSALRSPGRPLDPDVRASMEARFGHDFRRVRVHTGGPAAESANAIGASAYTAGNDIVFAPGRYAPDSVAGRTLLAHEMTHVLQQNRGAVPSGRVQREEGPEDATPSPAPAPPATSTAGGTAPPSSAPAPSAAAPAGGSAAGPGACNPLALQDITSQAAGFLTDTVSQLNQYQAETAVPRSAGPSADHQRIGAALRQAFNTDTLSYSSVISGRLRHVADLLGRPGSVAFTCGGPHCAGSSTSVSVGYVERPYALNLCNLGTPGNRPILGFIHEMCHAVVPQIGIRTRITAVGGGVRDRAYTGERVYGHLSPEETLDNADSYETLVDLLHSRVNRQIVSPQADTTPGCAASLSDRVLSAFARAEQWNRYAADQLSNYIEILGGGPVTALPAGDLNLLRRFFPGIDATALQALYAAYHSLRRHGFSLASVDLACAAPLSPECRGGALGFTYTGSVTASAVSLNTINTLQPINVCPAWLTAPEEDRIRTLYALFLIGRPAWIVAGFQLNNAFTYIDYAREVVDTLAPAPTTTHAGQHLLHGSPSVPGGTPSSAPAHPPATGGGP